MSELARVVVTRPFMGICAMGVCAVSDATDDEILDACNSLNPSGTSKGWVEVVREVEEGNIFKVPQSLPIRCADDAARTHFIVLC